MSQLTGDIPLSLNSGCTFLAILEITATLQERRKVIYELASNNKPCFTIALDENDFLYIELRNVNDNSFFTPRISPNKFAAYYFKRVRPKELERPFLLTIRVSPSDLSEKFTIEVFINGELHAETRAEGNLPEGLLKQSLGAGVDLLDPATFSSGDVVVYGRPLSDKELAGLDLYFNKKWGVGSKPGQLTMQIALLKDQNKKAQRNQKILLVEDTYNQIYKIAWLKLNNHPFFKENLEDIFREKCHFVINSSSGAGKLAGYLRQEKSLLEMHPEIKVIGLFDFDYAGLEQFKCLEKNKEWSKNILGQKNTGLYKKRSDVDSVYAVLLPIPARLKDLADLSYSNYTSYVEIENLFPENFLKDNNFVEEKNAPGCTYLKIKGDVKDKVWREAILLPKESFEDFRPLFQTIEDLFRK